MKHAVRRLLATPIFTLTGLVTLGAAIGANALLFSVVNGVLLKPLPFAEPDRLVGVWHVAPGLGDGPMNQSPSTHLTYQDAGVFQGIGMWDNASSTVTGRGEPEQLDSLYVTDGTLPVLGVRPSLGRTFTADDDAPGSAETVLLSHEYWRRAFAGDPSAIGQSVVVDGRARQVIGVLPEGFRFLRYDPDLVLPFRLNRAEVSIGNFSYQGLARLKPGQSIADANTRVAQLLPGLADHYPLPAGFSREMLAGIRLGPLVRPLAVDVVGDIGRTLWTLLGAVGVLWLVACANVANLFLVRAETRQREFAVRVALGASLWQVARGLLSEAITLGLAGGALGLALAYAGIRLLLALEPSQLPRLNEIAIDPGVLLFTLVLSLAAGLIFGLIPIVKYANPRLAASLKEGGRGSSDGRERHRARHGLVVAQVALALVLLIGSGLMIRTFMAMRDVAPGFTDPQNVLTLRISVPFALVEDPDQVGDTYRQIVERLEAIPGVESAGVSSSITMDGNDSNDPLFVEDQPAPEGQIPPLHRYKWVGAGYFRTMGNPLIAGRAITWQDIRNHAPVGMVSAGLAREVWGSPAAALGKRIRSTPDNPWREVIGVVGDERDDGVTAAAPPIVYWPVVMNDLWETPVYVNRSVGLVIRTPRVGTDGFLREVQQAVWAVNPSLPLARVQTLGDLYDRSMAETSFTLVILGIAAGVTLLLGIVGLYGVIAYIVSARRREVGIRMALGADSGQVQWLFIGRGLALAGVGLVVGLVVAAGTMRLLASLLFGVEAFDPLTYGVVAGVLGSVALVATWLPARQATRIDPAIALRAD